MGNIMRNKFAIPRRRRKHNWRSARDHTHTRTSRTVLFVFVQHTSARQPRAARQQHTHTHAAHRWRWCCVVCAVVVVVVGALSEAYRRVRTRTHNSAQSQRTPHTAHTHGWRSHTSMCVHMRAKFTVMLPKTTPPTLRAIARSNMRIFISTLCVCYNAYK